MYKKVSTKLNFAEREQEVLNFWKENDIFSESIKNREGQETFTFYDGPPTANGKPHIGHILTRAFKDIIPRYKTMKGYKVLRKAGWDTHGLPVELEVEKMLGINGKPGIEEYGVEAFIKLCKESVWKYKGEWERMSERVGYWADMDNPYITYDNTYIESEWWAIKQIWDKDLLYKGYKIMPYCPRCGTSLSSHEVAQGYKDVIEKSIYVKFKVKSEDNTYIMAWTTTPWTLPSNVALAVNPKEDYVLVKYKGENMYVSNTLVDTLFEGEEKYEVVKTVKGTDLEYLEYVPLFDFANPTEKAYYVTCAEFVTLKEGTGVVHIAPAFGEDDALVGKKYKLPFVQLVDEQGLFIDAVTPWKGIFVKDADPMIIANLTERGLVYKTFDFEHSYPFCWRCDTPLLYYATDTWFIKMTAVRDKLLENNNKINWLPDNIRTGRFGNFLENVVDWGFSRSRYWGTPLPIWECECGHRHVIGSLAELYEMGIDVPPNIELHKPYIDEVLLNCPKCSGKMYRVPEVIDCWFDSGAMPFAQWHFPFENKETFNDNFPADFISEAIDQTRGWFYTLLAISTIIFDEPAFKNVIVLGHVNDKSGEKMSKHKGNVVDPWTVLDKQGADAVRWYFYTGSSPWLPSRFYEEAVSEGQKKFMGTLWNTYAFYVLYAGIDNFNAADYKLDYDKLVSMDKWILSKLNTLIDLVDTNLTNYRITESARAIQEFTEELSNWYVRRCRERFWQPEMPQDKINAYMTLNEVLTKLVKISAPFVPFISEQIYDNLVSGIYPGEPKSVHLCEFPVADKDLIDKNLEDDMDKVLKIVNMGRACRNAANIKNRQPIGKLFVQMEGATLPEEFSELVLEELNVKTIEFTSDSSQFSTFSFKPQLRTLGKKYGKFIPSIGQYLAGVNGTELMNNLKDNSIFEFEVEGQKIEITIDDVLYETSRIEGYETYSDGGITVVIDTNLTEDLIEEGFVRELVSKIQTMRKEAGFEVMDNISISHSNNDKIAEIFSSNANEIMSETLALDILANSNDSFYEKEWNINGEKVVLGVSKK
jgi:isoleucyl-tRNA synthetase